MKKVAKILSIIFVSYMVLWSALYFWIMKLDTSHFIEYFQLSWTNPGETPAFIQWGAILGTILVVLGYIARVAWVKRSDQ